MSLSSTKLEKTVTAFYPRLQSFFRWTILKSVFCFIVLGCVNCIKQFWYLLLRIHHARIYWDRYWPWVLGVLFWLFNFSCGSVFLRWLGSCFAIFFRMVLEFNWWFVWLWFELRTIRTISELVFYQLSSKGEF